MPRPAIAYIPGPEDSALELGADEYAGLEVVALIDESHAPARAGLFAALDRIAAGEASTLLLARLRDACATLPDLLTLIEWLESADADLLALDVGLDTGSGGAQSVIALLRELERWNREPGPGHPPRGRPGLASHAPELRERILEMRESGLSMQAIADALNAEDVPTQRGGTHWRPSSVQAALGYRRPRPSLHRATLPPPPPPPGHRPPHGRRSPRP